MPNEAPAVTATEAPPSWDETFSAPPVAPPDFSQTLSPQEYQAHTERRTILLNQLTAARQRPEAVDPATMIGRGALAVGRGLTSIEDKIAAPLQPILKPVGKAVQYLGGMLKAVPEDVATVEALATGKPGEPGYEEAQKIAAQGAGFGYALMGEQTPFSKAIDPTLTDFAGKVFSAGRAGVGLLPLAAAGQVAAPVISQPVTGALMFGGITPEGKLDPQAAAVGAAFQPVGNAVAEAFGKVAGKVLGNALVPAAKGAGHIVGSQLFFNASQLPDVVAAPPEKRWELIKDHIVQNAAYLAYEGDQFKAIAGSFKDAKAKGAFDLAIQAETRKALDRLAPLAPAREPIGSQARVEREAQAKQARETGPVYPQQVIGREPFGPLEYKVTDEDVLAGRTLPSQPMPPPVQPAGPGAEPPVTKPPAQEASTLDPDVFVWHAKEMDRLLAGLPNLFERVYAKKQPPATVSQIAGITPQSVPRKQIALRPYLMQFKEMDDTATGTNAKERLEGNWDYFKAGNLLLWEPLDPAKYGLTGEQRYIDANGHHRIEFGDRQKIDYHHSQIVREADGYGLDDARRLAAEINIADGKGTIYDQAKFIRNTRATHGADAALEEARRIGIKGRQSANIAISATDPVFTAFVNERITPDQTEAIAVAAPGDEALQGYGIRVALEGEKPDVVAEAMRSRAADARAKNLPKEVQPDWFKNTAMDDFYKEEARKVAQARKGIQDQISGRAALLRKYEETTGTGSIQAKKLQVTQELVNLRMELERWQRWREHPDLAAQIKGNPAATAETIKPTEAPDASRIPSDQTITPQAGQVPQGSEANRGYDVEQAPPKQPEPVEAGKEAPPIETPRRLRVKKKAEPPPEPVVKETAPISQLVKEAPLLPNAKKGEEIKPELMSPEEYAKSFRADYPDATDKDVREGLSNAIFGAATIGRVRLPVNATAVDAYGIKLPEGYVREGEFYVYKPPQTPAQLLFRLPKVRIGTPEGATFIRITDDRGRKSVQSIANAQSGSFRGVNVTKIEAGIINKDKKFQPMQGEVTVSEPPKRPTIGDYELTDKDLKRAGFKSLDDYADRFKSEYDEKSLKAVGETPEEFLQRLFCTKGGKGTLRSMR